MFGLDRNECEPRAWRRRIDAQHSLQLFDRSLDLPLLSQNPSPQHARRQVVWIDLRRAGQMALGLARFPSPTQGDGEVEVGIGEIRPEVDGATEVKLGLGQPIELDQGPRQVVVGLGVVGVGLQDLLEDGGGDVGLAAAARLDATNEEHPLAHAQRVEASREWIGKGDRLLLDSSPAPLGPAPGRRALGRPSPGGSARCFPRADPTSAASK